LHLKIKELYSTPQIILNTLAAQNEFNKKHKKAFTVKLLSPFFFINILEIENRSPAYSFPYSFLL